MEQITIQAYAKINLSLNVLNRRPDNYHTVRMIMQSLSLCDTLTLTKTQTKGISLSAKNAECYPDITWDEKNLIYKAAKLWFDTYPSEYGIHILIDKQIPSSAGLAGGSSDAAATLKGLNLLFNQNVSIEDLKKLGKQLGADVPYCIMLGTVVAEGIGEILTPLSPAPPLYCTLIKPEQGVSTKYIYEHLNLTNAKHPNTDAMIRAIETNDISSLCKNLDNILEPVALTLCPEITAIEDKLKELGAIGACMSGSGPTVFGLFTEETKAMEASTYFAEHGYKGRSFITSFYEPSKTIN